MIGEALLQPKQERREEQKKHFAVQVSGIPMLTPPPELIIADSEGDAERKISKNYKTIIEANDDVEITFKAIRISEQEYKAELIKRESLEKWAAK